MEHSLQTYISFIFNNDGERGYEQFFDDVDDIQKELIELELHENPDIALNVFHNALLNIDEYLCDYTPHQLSNAIDYVFNASLSDLGICYRIDELDLGKKQESIHALSKLFEVTFNQTAEPVLGHLSQKVKNRENRHLNSVCYMFWDTACIPYNCGEDITLACIEVMRKCARSSNIAIVEGALHGLGHMIGSGHDALIRQCIESANLDFGVQSKALRIYADAAKTGMVQ